MRDLLLAALALAAPAATACRPRPTATPEPASLVWEGAVRHGGTPLALTVELHRNSAGASGTVDADDLYALGYPLQNVRLRGDTVHFELPDLLPPGTFDGVRDRGRIRGNFRGVTDAADSVRGTVELWRRPPKQLPYRAEDVEFWNAEVTLDGTLMIPPGPGPHPVVVLLHGYRIMLVPGADHALQVPRTARTPDWRRPVPGWVDEMTEWVVGRSRGAAGL